MRVGQALLERKSMLACAESCTGGWVAEVVTATGGSWQWFERGYVSYSNAAKQELLGVKADTLLQEGAVSEAVVRVRAGRRFLACLGVGAAWMAATPALADDVATLVTTVCNACHMPDGNSVVPMFPKLAGQQAEYLEKQLADYITGKRPNDVRARLACSCSKQEAK